MKRSLISLLSVASLAASSFTGCISTGSPLSEDEEGTDGTSGDGAAGDGDISPGDGDISSGDGDASVGGLGGAVSGLFSDDFSGNEIRSFWRFVEPQSGSYGSMKGDVMEFVLPGGTMREMWVAGAEAPHLVQEGSFDDFYVEATFAGYPSASSEAQGIVIMEDEYNFIRFEYAYKEGEEKFLLAALDGQYNGLTWGGREIAFQGNSPRLRILREGNDFSFEYSFDGETYSDPINRTFDLDVTAVGVYATSTRTGDTTSLAVDDFRSLPLP